jgi:hypothetical protein
VNPAGTGSPQISASVEKFLRSPIPLGRPLKNGLLGFHALVEIGIVFYRGESKKGRSRHSRHHLVIRSSFWRRASGALTIGLGGFIEHGLLSGLNPENGDVKEPGFGKVGKSP